MMLQNDLLRLVCIDEAHILAMVDKSFRPEFFDLKDRDRIIQIHVLGQHEPRSHYVPLPSENCSAFHHCKIKNKE